jgi:hypothetical protein
MGLKTRGRMEEGFPAQPKLWEERFYDASTSGSSQTSYMPQALLESMSQHMP